MKLIKHFFTFLLFCLCFTVKAQYNPSAPAKQITSILTNSGISVPNSLAFYQAGIDCHSGTLKSIMYFLRVGGIFFFFNDSLKNCHLAALLTIPPGQDTVFKNCIISDSEYKELFTPWFLDGLKNYDQTHKLNAAAEKFIVTVNECMKPISGDELLSILPATKS